MKINRILHIGLAIALCGTINCYSQKTGNLSAKIMLKENWFVQQSAKVNLPGTVLSTQKAKRENWYKATVPSTVMGVLTANGLYKDLFVGENYKNIDARQFDDSWWYCREFAVPDLEKGKYVSLHFDGLNYYANIWLNGRLIASRDSVYGTFRRYAIDVTNLVKESGNVLAVEVFRAQPGDFNLGFVDWNPRPADENMGIWREVYLKINGNISLNNTYVESDVNTSTLDEASLTIKTTLKNHSSETVNGLLKGKIGEIEFSYPVSVAPDKTVELFLSPEQIPMLRVKNPRLWWCNNLGSPEMYQLGLKFEINNQVSDAENTTFGIRQVECYVNSFGYKGFRLNGREVLIKGAGWTDDIFLRDSLKSLETQVQYAKHLNLNTLRFESIWGNTQDVYDLCDKYGILAMVGWSCQWEWDEYLGKPCDDFGGIQTEKEMNLAISSFRDQVLWLRNHPSIFVWMAGSDKCPKPELEVKYSELFKSLDNRPYLASAGTRVSSVSGPTGVKMNGPYEYVSPNYWYVDTINGGAFGFNTETGPGPQLAVAESLKKMIPPDKRWPPNEIWNYHCTHSKQAFNTMDVFNRALEGRFGKPSNLDEYLLKSDAQSYEALKAMFEAFRANIPKTTGIIQWMFNSAWPSLYWHLYDYYLRPSAAYYAARKANQPVQLIYNYGNHAIYAVNETRQDAGNLKAQIQVLDINSRKLLNKELNINIPANSSAKIYTMDSIRETVFLDMKLLDAHGIQLAGNFYWLSAKPDEFAWDKTYWAYTPMKAYADFTALNTLPPSDVQLISNLSVEGENTILTARLANPTAKVAFMVSLALNNEKGESICPVFWDDNYFSLLPGEKREIRCTIPSGSLKDSKPEIYLCGWNVAGKIIPLR